MKNRPFSAVLCLLLLAACELAFALEHNRLRFVTLDFSPFVYAENGAVAGPSAEIIAAVCKRMAVSCSFELYPWRRAQELVKAGEAEGMMVVGRNPEREKWVRFSPPMFQTEYGYFVQTKNELHYRDPANLEGYYVGVFAPSNTANSLRKTQKLMIENGLKGIEIDERPDDDSGFKKLAVGRLDAVYSNRDRGYQIIRDHNLADKVRYAGADKQLHYFAGFARDGSNQNLLDEFDATYRQLYQEGVVDAIMAKYQLQSAEIK